MSLSIGLSIGIDRSFGNAGNTPLIATPTISNVSAAGASPLVLQVSDGSYVAGKYLQWEFVGSLTPAKNADGSYTTTTQKGVTFIDGDSWARLDLALGYSTPSGAFAFHCRVLQDDPSGAVTVTDQLGNTFNADASGWSTDYTDTISASVAAWTSTNGTKKSAQLTLTGTTVIQGTTGWGAFQSIAATIAGGSKTQWEITLTTLATDLNRVIAFGRYNGTTDFTTSNEPGVNDANGYAIQVTPGSTSCQVFDANATTIGNFTLSSAAALGDVFSDELDVSGTAGTHSIKIYRNNVLVGTISSLTLTGFTTAFAAIKSNEKLTANWGASAWTHTPDTGYTYYG